MTGDRLFALIGGFEKGPFTPGEIKAMVREGKLQADDCLRRENDSRWVRAGDVKGLAGLFEEAKLGPREIEALFEGGGGEAASVACPRCGAGAEAEAAFCTECGAALAGEASEGAAPKCPGCGVPLEPDALFCAVCGRSLAFPEAPVPEALRRLSEAPPPETPPPQADEVYYYEPTLVKKLTGFVRRHKFLTVAGAIVLVFAVVLAAAGTFDYADNGYVDGSVLGYAGSEEVPASPGPRIRDNAGTRQSLDFRVVSARGGGRTPRNVAADLDADGRRIAGAFAGAGGGNVDLEITVAQNGAVVKTTVRASSYKDPALEGKVVDAVRKCRLKPAEGITVAVVRLQYEEKAAGKGPSRGADEASRRRNTSGAGKSDSGAAYARVEIVDDEVDYEGSETIRDQVHRYLEKRPPKPYFSDKRRYEMGNIYDAGDNYTFRVDNPHAELVLYFSWAPISGPMGLSIADEKGRVIFDRKLGEGPTLKLVGKGRYVVTVYYAGAKYGGTWHCEYYV